MAPYIRVDCSFYRHPKVAGGLHRGKSYGPLSNRDIISLQKLWIESREMAQDGCLNRNQVARILRKDWSRVCARLAQNDLLTIEGEVYRIHDYLDHQDSPLQIDRARTNSRQRVQRWRDKQYGNAVTPTVTCNAVTPDVTRGEEKGREGKGGELFGSPVDPEKKETSQSPPGTPKNGVPESVVREVFDHYLVSMGLTAEIYRLTPKRRQIIKRGLGLFDPDDLKAAITACAKEPFNQGKNDQNRKYRDIEKHILKNEEQIEGWIRRGMGYD